MCPVVHRLCLGLSLCLWVGYMAVWRLRRGDQSNDPHRCGPVVDYPVPAPIVVAVDLGLCGTALFVYEDVHADFHCIVECGGVGVGG